MGCAMYQSDESDYEAFLQQVIDGENFVGASLGITKLVIAKGMAALSPRQEFVFKRDVEDVYVTDECDNCGN